MTKGSIIAIWGNSGSGKTTTSIKLASRLAAMKKEVIVVLTDITAPDINVLLPHEKKTRSMGGIWSTPDCSIEVIYKSCMVTDSDNICLLGYKNGENVFSNSDYTKDNIVDILMKLRGIVDYVIIDCVSEFAYNVLTTVALEVADKVVRLQEATPKAFSFFDSNLNLLLDSRYKCNQHIKVLSKIKPGQAKDSAIHHYGGNHLELPYIEEIERQMLEGALFSLTEGRSSKGYNHSMDELTKMISADKEAAIPKSGSKPDRKAKSSKSENSKSKSEKKGKAGPSDRKPRFRLIKNREALYD